MGVASVLLSQRGQKTSETQRPDSEILEMVKRTPSSDIGFAELDAAMCLLLPDQSGDPAEVSEKPAVRSPV